MWQTCKSSIEGCDTIFTPLTPDNPGEPLFCLVGLGTAGRRFRGDKLLLMCSLSWVARGAALAIILIYCLSLINCVTYLLTMAAKSGNLL